MLPHDHIVEVLDFQATHDGSYALVMEFLYGEELRNTLKREGTMPPERVVRMVEPDRHRPRRRPRSKVRAPRSEARQRVLVPDARGRHREDPRLRLGEGQERSRQEAHRDGHDDRLAVLHGARAGAGARDARSPRRRVGARGDHLRVARGQRSVQGQQRSQHLARDPRPRSRCRPATRPRMHDAARCLPPSTA